MATVALLNGKTLGFGAPPAREMRDGGDFCISSATVKGKDLGYNSIIVTLIIFFSQDIIMVQRSLSHFSLYFFNCHEFKSMIILFKLTLLLGLNRCWGGREGDMGGTDQTKKNHLC